jgi:hypothetical protein
MNLMPYTNSNVNIGFSPDFQSEGGKKPRRLPLLVVFLMKEKPPLHHGKTNTFKYRIHAFLSLVVFKLRLGTLILIKCGV